MCSHLIPAGGNSNSHIVHLNVGGNRFATSRQTLTWVPDSFFTSMLSGRISTLKDETGAIFIDRDPKLFTIILNFMRTKDIDLRDVDVAILRHEAEYYGITPLVKRLILCEDLNHSSCGDVLFHGYLPPAGIPPLDPSVSIARSNITNEKTDNGISQHDIENVPSTSYANNQMSQEARPGTVLRVVTETTSPQRSTCAHSRNSSLDKRFPPVPLSRSSSDLRNIGRGHSRASSLDLRHSRNSSADLTKNLKMDLGLYFNTQGPNGWTDPLRVRIVKGHHNWIAVAYAHFVTCYRWVRLRDSTGWQHAFTSSYIDSTVEKIALNAKVVSNQSENSAKMLAISYGSQVQLWGITEDGIKTEIGIFNLHVPVDNLFFIGSQLVALSHTGKVGVWHAMTQHWQIQDVVPIASFDTAGSFLLLGCNNGSIYYIDM